MGSTFGLAALGHAAEALMSPLEWPSRETWLGESLVRLRALLGAEASIVMGDAGSGRRLLSPDLPESVLAALEAHLHGPAREVHWDDPEFDHAYGRYRRHPSRIYTMRDLRQSLGGPLEESPIYQSVIEPTGLLGSVSIGVVSGDGELLLSVMARDQAALDLEGERLAGMHLLRRAFVTGLATLERLEGARTTLGAVLDRLGTGLAVCGRNGAPEYRNARLGELLAAEPERERLRGLIGGIARLVAAPVAERLRDRGLQAGEDQEATLAGGTYRLVGTRIAPGILGWNGAILVLVDRVRPRRPSVDDLVRRFGLSRSEAEVALLVTEGHSNGTIARRLRLSAHTVRHRLERVFDKLDLHSRSALVLRLLQEGSTARDQ